MDNLTATSSPIQMVLDDKRPGNARDVVEKNRKAFMELVGPLLTRELSAGPWMGGETFTALDVVLGYNMKCVYDKRKWVDSV